MQIDEVQARMNGVNGLIRAESVTKASAAKPVGRSDSGRLPEATLAQDSATLGAGATLASQLAGASEVRMEKVAAVQQALASGTYQVDTGKVADKIIAEMLENQR